MYMNDSLLWAVHHAAAVFIFANPDTHLAHSLPVEYKN
jgi:hypothetical protein